MIASEVSRDSFSQYFHAFDTFSGGSILRADFFYTGSFLHAARQRQDIFAYVWAF